MNVPAQTTSPHPSAKTQDTLELKMDAQQDLKVKQKDPQEKKQTIKSEVLVTKESQEEPRKEETDQRGEIQEISSRKKVVSAKKKESQESDLKESQNVSEVCPSCAFVMSQNGRVGRLLHCGHNLCCVCIRSQTKQNQRQNMENNKIICSVCDGETILEETKDYYLLPKSPLKAIELDSEEEKDDKLKEEKSENNKPTTSFVLIVPQNVNVVKLEEGDLFKEIVKEVKEKRSVPAGIRLKASLKKTMRLNKLEQLIHDDPLARQCQLKPQDLEPSDTPAKSTRWVNVSFPNQPEYIDEIKHSNFYESYVGTHTVENIKGDDNKAQMHLVFKTSTRQSTIDRRLKTDFDFLTDVTFSEEKGSESKSSKRKAEVLDSDDLSSQKKSFGSSQKKFKTQGNITEKDSELVKMPPLKF